MSRNFFFAGLSLMIRLLNFGTPFNKLLAMLNLSHLPIQDFIGLQTGQDNVNGPHEKQGNTATPLNERIFAS